MDIDDADDKLTAVHEAGHAWAFWKTDYPLRDVTIRPRQAGLVGVCRRPTGAAVDVGKALMVAGAGPVAQAIATSRVDRASEFADHLSGAVLYGGCEDARHTFDLLDNCTWVAALRDDLESDWAGVERVADLLIKRKTVTGCRISRALDELLR